MATTPRLEFSMELELPDRGTRRRWLAIVEPHPHDRALLSVALWELATFQLGLVHEEFLDDPVVAGWNTSRGASEEQILREARDLLVSAGHLPGA